MKGGDKKTEEPDERLGSCWSPGKRLECFVFERHVLCMRFPQAPIDTTDTDRDAAVAGCVAEPFEARGVCCTSLRRRHHLYAVPSWPQEGVHPGQWHDVVHGRQDTGNTNSHCGCFVPWNGIEDFALIQGWQRTAHRVRQDSEVHNRPRDDALKAEGPVRTK